MPNTSMKPLIKSAVVYLADLQHAADLAVHEQQLAELAERGHWLSGYRRFSTERGHGAALNSPTAVIDGRIFNVITRRLDAARVRVGYVAWWYTTAALAAVRAVLDGQEMNGRRLEQLTLLEPGRDHRMQATLAWERCLRPALPALGQLSVGSARLDEAMEAALDPLHRAYASAAYALSEDPAQDEDQDDEALDPTDQEVSDLAQAEQHARQIPDLLLTYARVVHQAALYASQQAERAAQPAQPTT